MLCVQRTGWGKSAVYFLATALLRERGAGPTLIVSPLLALMRNQIAAARAARDPRAHDQLDQPRRRGTRSATLLAADAVDLLLISPERLNNPQFRDAMLPLFAERVGLLVVDEAHCISDWGHDFRPDYRRMAEMLERLPDRASPCSATTATANDRVVADVERAARAGDARRAAAHLPRPARRARACGCEVVELPGAGRAARVAGPLAAAAATGSGIVYTLTKRDAEMRRRLARPGAAIAAEAYSRRGRAGAPDRGRGAAAGATRSRPSWPRARSAWATTSPTSASSCTTRRPGSVIAYYQQVGRAGRGVDHADVVLLRGAEDRRIQDFFIEQAFPRRERRRRACSRRWTPRARTG